MSEIDVAIRCIEQLREGRGINIFAMMIRLRSALGLIVDCKSSDRLRDLLLKLSSESIRESLHKNELHITNAVIESKNRILRDSGIAIPEDHQLIQSKNYDWNW